MTWFNKCVQRKKLILEDFYVSLALFRKSELRLLLDTRDLHVDLRNASTLSSYLNELSMVSFVYVGQLSLRASISCGVSCCTSCVCYSMMGFCHLSSNLLEKKTALLDAQTENVYNHID